MRKPLPIQLSIPSPCSQSWDGMTPDAQGRYCAHCQKSVIDFTSWSDRRLYDFFTTTKEEVCGHFDPGQLNRTINIPPQPHSKLYRIAIALGLTILAAQAQEARARVMPPLMEQNILAPADDTLCSDSITIKGQVLDERKEPLIGGVVQLEKDGLVIAGTMTDIDGYFEIVIKQDVADISNHFGQLRISYPGYKQELRSLFINSKFKINPIVLEVTSRHLGATGGAMAIFEKRPPLIDAEKTGPNKTFTTKDLHNMGY